MVMILFCVPTLLSQSVKIDFEKEIVFGQSGAFTGSMSLYAQTIKDGINAYFSRVNKQGGIKGKTLRLISLDDKGMISLALKNVAELKKQEVTMFIGNMGTDNVLALTPFLKRDEIALFFPWGGDNRLSDPSLTSIINGPGLMEPQLAKLADYVVRVLGHKRVVIFYADDSFSTSAAEQLERKLESKGVKALATVSYNRFTLGAFNGFDKLLAVEPRAVLCIGTSTPVSKLINYFFERGHYATHFLGIDSTLFVGNKLTGKGAAFYYTAAVPDPKTSKMLLAQQYLHDITRYCPHETPNVLSFTYYISAAILVEALKNLEGPITQRAIIQYIESMHEYDLNGFFVNFNAETRHAYGSDVKVIKG